MGATWKRPASLRGILVGVTICVAALAALVATALIVLTSLMHETTERTVAAVDGVRLAEEAEIHLLLHERATDPLLRREVESDLLARLRAVRFVSSAPEAIETLDVAKAAVDDYFLATRDGAAPKADVERKRDDAYSALEELIRVHVDASRQAQASAATWDRVANVIGIGVTALVALVAAGMLLWLRGGAFEPLIHLSRKMQAFGRGDVAVRADASGPTEVREMAAQFNDMADAIAAQRKAQVAFLASVAHDLRNPLNALRMSASLLSERSNLSAEQHHAILERLVRQISRLDRMLGDFLDLSNIEAGNLDLRSEEVDVRGIVEEVAALFQDASRHRLRVHVPAQPVVAICDPGRIEQVVTNLVSNAMKYAPETSRIDVTVKARGDEVELSVEDRGVGISEADRARLFEPFRRVGSTKELIPGVGLGLFAARKIVEAHGGRIEVDSMLGAGSVFRVVLPRGDHVDRGSEQAAVRH